MSLQPGGSTWKVGAYRRVVSGGGVTALGKSVGGNRLFFHGWGDV